MLKARYILRLVGAFVARFRTLIVIGILIGVAFFFILKFLLPALSGGIVERIGITGQGGRKSQGGFCDSRSCAGQPASQKITK